MATRLEQLWKDGTLARVGPGCRTVAELAERLGMSKSAYESARERIVAQGRPFPSFAEVTGLVGRVSASGSTVAQIDAAIGEPFVQGLVDRELANHRNPDTVIATPIPFEEEKTDPHRKTMAEASAEVWEGAFRGKWRPDSTIEMNSDRDAKPQVAKPWPCVAAFDAEQIANENYASTTTIHRWTDDDVPDGSVIGVLSDIHIPHHDDAAMRLVIECLEDAGVTHVILNGDIADCGPASRHQGKRQRAMLDEGDLRESVAPGMWIFDWARTKQCIYTLGNHEAWVVDLIKQTPEIRGTAATELMGLPANGDGWIVLPPLSRVRFGSRVWEHLDGFFKTGNGGANPGSRIKTMAPHQTTSGGHLHRCGSFFWTSEDERGISRTFGAFFNGHLSLPSAHTDYMGGYMNWQQSFEITRKWSSDGRPRFTTDQIEIHRTKQGRPVFEYAGKVYGR